MKYINKIMKERGIEEDIKEWRDSLYGRTILMKVTRWGRQNILKWLIHELQFDVNEQNSYGSTSLHWASLYDHMECARLLLDAGSLHLKDVNGNTPLHLAKTWGNNEMQNLLELHLHSS